MLTIFSIPKPFHGHIETIQRNAIQSWLKMEPHCEIFLCGDEQGVAEAAQEFNVFHIPDIEKNEYGTPLLSSAFKVVRERASNSLICYVNSDIIFLNNIMDAIRMVPFQSFLLLGQRWNLEINDPIDYHRPSWEKALLEKLTDKGELQSPFGSDYFIFPKNTPWDFPEFTVGRPGWDNWIIYRARVLKIPVIDATEVGTAIHQNHSYAHIPGRTDPVSFEGPEADKNRNLMGGEDHIFFIRDATHRLTGRFIRKALDYQYLGYRLKRQPVLDPSCGHIARIRWRFLSALYYRRQYFPRGLLQNLIYSSTK